MKDCSSNQKGKKDTFNRGEKDVNKGRQMGR
jgi:hypothetical protein